MSSLRWIVLVVAVTAVAGISIAIVLATNSGPASVSSEAAHVPAVSAQSLMTKASDDARAQRRKLGPCFPEGSESYRENREFRIFRTTNKLSRHGDTYLDGGYVACDKRSGRWREIFRAEFDLVEPSSMELVGSFAVGEFDWGCAACDGNTPTSLELIDLQTGRRTVLEQHDGGSEDWYYWSNGKLTRDGTFTYQVRRVSAKGQTVNESVRADAATGRRMAE